MSARKCKVCGEREVPSCDRWCMTCFRAYDRKVWPLGLGAVEAAAEWGAKRRAAAQKKAGGK